MSMMGKACQSMKPEQEEKETLKKKKKKPFTRQIWVLINLKTST